MVKILYSFNCHDLVKMDLTLAVIQGQRYYPRNYYIMLNTATVLEYPIRE